MTDSAPRLCSNKPPVSELFTAYIPLITCCSQATWEPALHTTSKGGIFVQKNAAAAQEGKSGSPCSKWWFLKAELVAGSWSPAPLCPGFSWLSAMCHKNTGLEQTRVQPA